MKSLIKYLRKVIPHNSPLRLWYTRLKNLLARILLPINTNKLVIIGVTGTDGKTTTVEMMSHILTELNVPNITASSYAIKENGEIKEMSKRTTSSAFAVRKLLKKALTDNIKVVVIEASSHSMVQWRLLGVQFDASVLTNITHEHLNFHKTIKNYASAKKLVFTKNLKLTGKKILPTDDKFGKKWIEEFGKTAVSYNSNEIGAITDKYGTAFVYNNAQYSIPMPGSYNAGNAIAAALAISSVDALGVTVDKALSSLNNFTGIPGRMQIVQDNVIVDFALTEKAMASALATAREIAGGDESDNKVTVVFGASGGQHDASVHKGLASAAALGADITIVTDDEPYDGDPAKIRENLINYIKETNTEIEKSNGKVAKFKNIADRREAIRHALQLATSGDVVVVTGMGHYTSRTINGIEEPWSDYDTIKEELENSSDKFGV